MEAEAADRVHEALLDLGYQCLYRSEDAVNYVRAAQGLDLLYAHRPLARRMLVQASERKTPLVREVGVPFQPPLGNVSGIDPIAEWLSLMEAVKMLCQVWPVREKPMQGNHWRL